MLGVAWFSGAYEEAPNCSIAYSRLSSDGAAFEAGAVVSLRPDYSNQNPVLWLNDTQDGGDGTLHLWHTTAPANSGEGSSQLRHLTSEDAGASWTPPAPFTTLTGVFDRNRIITSPPGTQGARRPLCCNAHFALHMRSHNAVAGLLYPVYNSSGVNYAFDMRYASDTGTWGVVPIPHTANLVQPTIVRLTPAEPGKIKVSPLQPPLPSTCTRICSASSAAARLRTSPGLLP